MNMDPPRILEPGSLASSGLKELVRSTEDDGPRPAELSGLHRRMEGLVVGALSAASAGTGLGTAGTAGGAKIALGAKALSSWWAGAAVVALSAGATGGVTWYRHARAPTAPSATPRLAPPVSLPSLSRAAVEDAPMAVASPVAPRPPPAPRVRHSVPTEALEPPAVPHAPAPAPAPALPSVSEGLEETQALAHAFRALQAGDAATAVAMAQEHERQFPESAVLEEREAILIEALVKLGRRDEARHRLEALKVRFPRSAYSWRLEALF
jgi:hypothetical protein